jgi:hypothetical protein
MTDPATAPASDRSRSRTYWGVVLVEAVVLTALWLFGQYFSR